MFSLMFSLLVSSSKLHAVESENTYVCWCLQNR